jgi:hypothetical protein
MNKATARGKGMPYTETYQDTACEGLQNKTYIDAGWGSSGELGSCTRRTHWWMRIRHAAAALTMKPTNRCTEFFPLVSTVKSVPALTGHDNSERSGSRRFGYPAVLEEC